MILLLVRYLTPAPRAYCVEYHIHHYVLFKCPCVYYTLTVPLPVVLGLAYCLIHPDKMVPLYLRYCTEHIFVKLGTKIVIFTTYSYKLCFYFWTHAPYRAPQLPHLVPRIPLHAPTVAPTWGPQPAYIIYTNLQE